MMLIEETTLPQAALPISQFREHLRLGSGFSDDGLQDPVLESYLRAAIAAIEARTGKILIEREFSWTLTEWRNAVEQALPLAPVNMILDVVLMDGEGGESVVDRALWRLVPDMQRPAIAAQGACLPAIPQNGAARLRLLVGFGPDWGDLPADLGQAVLMLAAYYYEHRHEVALGGAGLPYSVNALIERYRAVRLTAGGAS